MSSKTEQNTRVLLFGALHIGVLFNLVIAQPLLQKLSDNPEFLVAHAATRGDIFTLVAILCFLLPALIILVESLARIFGKITMRVVHYSFVFLLFTIFAFLMMRQFSSLEGVLAVLVSIASGAALTFVYHLKIVRSTLTYLAPVILVVPLLFLTNSSIRKLISTNKVVAQSASVNVTAPVVMVVFDELPITSLMNEDLLLDGVLFPNFARLLEDFTWYRNTTTVSHVTSLAVPAILTGKYPDRKLLPTVSDHPENVFTLLGGSHQLNVVEAATSLCPSDLNVLASESSVSHLRLLLFDLAAVYLHMMIPQPYSSQLPGVTTTWSNFWGLEKEAKGWKTNQAAYFGTFMESIAPSKRPFFSFLHISLPHRPWRYLPDGKKYNDFYEGRRRDKFWGQDDWAATIALQRHLLQLAYADTLLGELMQHLNKTGLYDRCLVVIVADHGISLWRGEEARKITATTYQDILFVPFFLKAPFQKKGAIIDRKLETVDILPTMAKVLGIKTSWKFDGYPAMDTSLPERRYRKIFLHDRLVSDLRHDIHDQNRTLQRKVALFGNATSASALYNIGPFPELLNRRISELPVSQSTDLIINLRGKSEFENVNLSSQMVPAYVAGEIKYRENMEELPIAIAINGKISAVTIAFHSAGKLRFSVIVPPSAFRNGKNSIDVIIPKSGNEKFIRAILK